MLEYQNDKRYLELVGLVVKIEGGYVNDPNDSGGPTKWGVAWNYNADALKKLFGFKSSADMKNLTKEQATELYYQKYYIASESHKISDIDLAYIHFDCAVNQGLGTAEKIIKALSPSPFHYDGSGGKNRLLFLQLFLDYVTMRLKQYTKTKKVLRTEYLSGWVNRVAKVMEDSKELD